MRVLPSQSQDTIINFGNIKENTLAFDFTVMYKLYILLNSSDEGLLWECHHGVYSFLSAFMMSILISFYYFPSSLRNPRPLLILVPSSHRVRATSRLPRPPTSLLPLLPPPLPDLTVDQLLPHWQQSPLTSKRSKSWQITESCQISQRTVEQLFSNWQQDTWFL